MYSSKVHWTIPYPDPDILSEIRCPQVNSSRFLEAANIEKDSEEHKELLITVRRLYSQYLHPFKLVEEQPDEADNLIANARLWLPWLARYENSWPARVYLKRYVDNKRPHLKKRQACSRGLVCPGKKKIVSIRKKELKVKNDRNCTLIKFLASLSPSLEHRRDGFIESGINDRKTLQAFLSWPRKAQEEFLNDCHEVLHLTRLEEKAFLMGCETITQNMLKRTLEKPGYFPF